MDRIEKLEKEPIRKLLLNLSIPSIISLLMNSINIAADRMFVGNCVGTKGISAVTVSYGIYLLMQGFSQLVSVGAASAIAIKLGRKDQEGAEKVLGNVFTLSFVLSIFISVVGLTFMKPLLRLYGANTDIMDLAVQYTRIFLIGSCLFVFSQSLNCVVRGMGNAKQAMINFLVDIFMNIILDIVFVCIFNMGVFGAAMATTLSSGICAVMAFYYLVAKEKNVKVKVHNFKLDNKIVKSIIGIGAASAIIQLTMSMSSLVYNRICMLYGGSKCVAVYGIVSTLLLLVIMPIIGLTQGMQPIVSYNLGAGKINRIKETLKTGLLFGTGFTVASSLLMEFFGKQIIMGFGGKNDSELLTMGILALRISAISLPLLGIIFMGANYFQFIKESGKSICITLLRQIVLIVPFVIVFPIFGGVNGIFMASVAADVIVGILTVIILLGEMKRLDMIMKNSY